MWVTKLLEGGLKPVTPWDITSVTFNFLSDVAFYTLTFLFSGIGIWAWFIRIVCGLAALIHLALLVAMVFRYLRQKEDARLDGTSPLNPS